MRYMPIVPKGMFDMLDASNVDDVFILSQYWNDEEYRTFYTDRSWDRVVIDNALYEEDTPTPFEHMMEMADDIDANEIYIVGPEDLKNGINTAIMCQRVYDKVWKHLRDNQKMMIILHERPNEMRLQYKMLRDMDVAFGISIFSYRLGYDRASLYDYVGIDHKFYVHAFGWDNLLEMYNMTKCSGFKSIDSSIAVTAAINGIDLGRHHLLTRDPGKDGVKASTRAKITDTEFTYDQKLNALNNIIMLRDFCKRR